MWRRQHRQQNTSGWRQWVAEKLFIAPEAIKADPPDPDTGSQQDLGVQLCSHSLGSSVLVHSSECWAGWGGQHLHISLARTASLPACCIHTIG